MRYRCWTQCALYSHIKSSCRTPATNIMFGSQLCLSKTGERNTHTRLDREVQQQGSSPESGQKSRKGMTWAACRRLRRGQKQSGRAIQEAAGHRKGLSGHQGGYSQKTRQGRTATRSVRETDAECRQDPERDWEKQGERRREKRPNACAIEWG